MFIERFLLPVWPRHQLSRNALQEIIDRKKKLICDVSRDCLCSDAKNAVVREWRSVRPAKEKDSCWLTLSLKWSGEY